MKTKKESIIFPAATIDARTLQPLILEVRGYFNRFVAGKSWAGTKPQINRKMKGHFFFKATSGQIGRMQFCERKWNGNPPWRHLGRKSLALNKWLQLLFSSETQYFFHKAFETCEQLHTPKKWTVKVATLHFGKKISSLAKKSWSALHEIPSLFFRLVFSHIILLESPTGNHISSFLVSPCSFFSQLFQHFLFLGSPDFFPCVRSVVKHVTAHEVL